MAKLLVHGAEIDTVFDLIGRDENDMTYALGWAYDTSTRRPIVAPDRAPVASSSRRAGPRNADYALGMSRRYPPDIIDGREVPPLVVTTDFTLEGVHAGSVQVESGHLDLVGTLQGSLSIHPGASATITGRQQGSVHVGEGVSVTVLGAIEGSTHVSLGGDVIVERDAKLAGSLHNDGRVVIKGVFGGTRSGSGSFVVAGGYIKEPEIIDGAYVYDWSSERRR